MGRYLDVSMQNFLVVGVLNPDRDDTKARGVLYKEADVANVVRVLEAFDIEHQILPIENGERLYTFSYGDCRCYHSGCKVPEKYLVEVLPKYVDLDAALEAVIASKDGDVTRCNGDLSLSVESVA